MKILFAPEPFGTGTHYAESFLSVVHRTNRIYRIPLNTMTRFLLAMAPQKASVKSVESQAVFVGYSRTTELLAEQFGRLTSTDQYRCHTLLKLKDVLARHSNGVIHPRYRWCPDCLSQDEDGRYGLLAHCMQSLDICPKHFRYLREQCPDCGFRPTLSASSPFIVNCTQCATPLANSDPHELNARQLKLRERRLLDVVSYASDPETPWPHPAWHEQMVKGLQCLAEQSGTYTAVEMRDMARRIRANNLRIRFDTLLRLAETQMLDFKTLLINPEEAFSTRLPGMGPADKTAKRRNSKPVDLWFALRRTALQLIKLPKDEILPGWRAVCALAGVSDSGFWQHFPDVSLKYSASRFRRWPGNPVPVARLFAKVYSTQRLPEPRGRDLPPDALEAACEVIDRNLGLWIVRPRVRP